MCVFIVPQVMNEIDSMFERLLTSGHRAAQVGEAQAVLLDFPSALEALGRAKKTHEELVQEALHRVQSIEADVKALQVKFAESAARHDMRAALARDQSNGFDQAAPARRDPHVQAQVLPTPLPIPIASVKL